MCVSALPLIFLLFSFQGVRHLMLVQCLLVIIIINYYYHNDCDGGDGNDDFEAQSH